MSRHAAPEPLAPAPVITADGISVRRGRREVLHGVDLIVSRGEVVALVGPNGAGKSTLLAALGGSLALRSGTITRNGRVATVLQSPALANRSAVANVELALAWWRVPRSQRSSRALDALKRMSAGHLGGQRAHTLSGGEQRRVHLARAIAVSPDLLLLDEPFDGLDPQAHEALREDTATVLRAADSAVVVVLHDRADAWAMADRLVVLIDGHIQADGAPQQLLDDPPTPQVARLLGYDGELSIADEVVHTRPSQIRIGPDGAYAASVERLIGIEDGTRVLLHAEQGRVWSRHPGADLRVGDQVRFDLLGGARFPLDAV